MTHDINMANRLLAADDSRILLLVDDMIGSGDTICDWLSNPQNKPILNLYLKLHRVFVVCVAIAEKGFNKLRKEYPLLKVFGDITPKAFKHVGAVFGGSVKMKSYQDLCYKYGCVLSKGNPLGYGNCQSLVVFEHGTPNNTLPIIWSRSKFNGKRWFPLFARFSEDRIATTHEPTKEQRKWLVYLASLFGYDEVTQKLFSTSNMYLLRIINLKYRKIEDYTIAHILGVSSAFLDKLIQQGIEKKLWDKNFKLTEQTVKAYEDAIKKIAIRHTEERERKFKSDAVLQSDIIYIPETFKGVK